MIKLPIILTEHPDWRAAIHGAIETRAQLAETAKTDSRYIRPLALFQAQDKGQEVTVEVLKNYLIENENIATERIAIATGEQRELDNINLFNPACSIDFIITVEALKEGWDCSFAYVLCSVANIGSSTDIEQLLGRVLRMPYTQSRANQALNHAYAHISSPRFGEGARALVDTLIEKMGFQSDEAEAAVEQRQQVTIAGFEPNADLFNRAPVLIETLEAAPDLSGLDSAITERVTLETQADGTVKVSIEGDIPEELEKRLIATVTTPTRQAAIRAAVHRHSVNYRNSKSPAERGENFAVPRLFLNIQGELELAEEELILELGGWTLNNYAAELSPAEFSIKETAERWEVDLNGERVVYKHLDQNTQLEIGFLKLDWTDLQLSRWLDKQCRQPDLTQPVLLEFCRKVVAYLLETRHIAMNDLLRFKYQLAKAIAQKIAEHRQHAYKNSYQTFLFSPTAPVETRFDDGFAFEKRHYPPSWGYQGAYQFKKHFFGMVGELEAKGEEFECARLIDTLPQVKHWVRNLSGRPQSAFWLPTSTDRFYPDFVAELNDGRIFVIEYKGAHLADTGDTKEKRNIGELWADKSSGKGLFLIAEKINAQGQDIRQQLLAVIG